VFETAQRNSHVFDHSLDQTDDLIRERSRLCKMEQKDSDAAAILQHRNSRGLAVSFS
jgi:hypothetical protein